MARPRASQSQVAGSVRALSDAPRSTRELLVELAAEVFATEGYAAASVRDLGRRLGVTSGALYGNFRGKADLLAEAVDARLTTDLWTLPDDVSSQSLVDVVAYQFAHYQSRKQLMSLLLEGAVAARTDAEVKQRLHETVAVRLDGSARAFELRREAEGFDPAVDLDAAVKIVWSIEIGLRVLSELGFDIPAEDDCSDVVRRFVKGLQVSAAPPRASGRRAKASGKAPRSRRSATSVSTATPSKAASKDAKKRTAKPVKAAAKKPAPRRRGA
jgi:AcrR family transcriptional regulator